MTEPYRNRLREVAEQFSTDHREALSALESVGMRMHALRQSLQAARLADDASMKARLVRYSTTYETLSLRRDISGIRHKLFDRYLDVLKLQLTLKSVRGTLDEPSLIAVDSFLESNAANDRGRASGDTQRHDRRGGRASGRLRQ